LPLLIAACQWLADVVEQRCEPRASKVKVGMHVSAHGLQPGSPVGPGVTVPVYRILLELHGRQFRKELVGKSRLDREPKSSARMIGGDELVKLIADSLRRDDLETTVHRGDRSSQRFDRLELITGDEAGRAQHAQRVVAEGDL